jgi:hypothetical protein
MLTGIHLPRKGHVDQSNESKVRQRNDCNFAPEGGSCFP